MSEKFKSVRITTPEFKVSFPKIFKADSYNDGPLKYSVTMLFPKSTDLSALKKAAGEVATAKWPDPANRPRNMHNPFRDGDNEKPDLEGYSGSIFVTASCLADKHTPQVLDDKGNRIVTEQDFYAGCYAKAIVDVFAFDNPMKKGVTFGLVHLMKTKDGEAFSGAPRVSAEEAFGFSSTGGEYVEPGKQASNSDVDAWF